MQKGIQGKPNSNPCKLASAYFSKVGVDRGVDRGVDVRNVPSSGKSYIDSCCF